MTKQKLFVIGNGFDIYHGIESRYSDFRKYLETIDRGLCQKIEYYFDYENLWSDFEQALADFDANQLVDDSSEFLVPYSAEGWRDANNHDYQYVINEVVRALSHTLKSRFTSWVLQLKIPSNAGCNKRLDYIDKNAMFLTFNYTPTLQHVYAVADKNVLHLHGKAESEISDLIIGHAWSPSERTPFNESKNIEDQDFRITEGNEIIKNYFKLTYKPTEDII